MKQFWLQILGLLILIFGALYFTFTQGLGGVLVGRNGINSNINPSPTQRLRIVDSSSNQNLQIVKAEINVEVADTKEKRVLGLGGRNSLDQNSGMIFNFEKADKHVFWMKGMKIPLDFIWIKGGEVVDLIANVQPPQPDQIDDGLPRYKPQTEADQVLEVNAGFIQRNNIKNADKILLEVVQ